MHEISQKYQCRKYCDWKWNNQKIVLHEGSTRIYNYKDVYKPGKSGDAADGKCQNRELNTWNYKRIGSNRKKYFGSNNCRHIEDGDEQREHSVQNSETWVGSPEW